MTTQAPAKINLSLRITGKRDDGFHGLKTLVLPITSLCDELTFKEADTFSLKCETPGVPTDESNLVSRALRLFEKGTGIPCPYEITLTKRIPHGAGLGGGSADAAHTFLALNQLTDAGVPLEKMAGWAAELGSDIPLFLYEKPCWCTGRGQIIESAEIKWTAPIILFKPSFDIPTPWAYQNWANSQEIPGISYEPQEADGQRLFNDLERPVFEKHRFLATLKSYLQSQSETTAAMMSGSGSTIFAVLDPEANAEAFAKETLAAMDPTMWWHVHR
ncbi:4-(cytidine 5'-diphospho)-2-C-methyl-D-erythritol kinase [Akkermansiaceae bacterium]|nr:4-(cytidine 5'-diphospho)-2-C-methyl-D-erythritol kinase [Akkermansiaceae bacterium]MDB4499276.1 4-(cytidine 5'-diphospho)-2-C-methyl-D-erythritol kinase [Akkermansiaceae bacterium]